LRTPMNAILGYVHLLLLDSGQSLTPQQRDDLRQVQASGRRLARAIDAVIELLRLECGRVALAIESTDLTALAAEARRHAIAATGVAADRVALVHDGEALRADIDPMRLGGALAAIVRHLILLSPRQPLTIAVRRADGDGVIAIAAEPEPNPLGRRPTRRPAAALPSGAPALDIAAASRLVELLGGAMAVDADPAIGSRVTIRVPLTSEEPPPLGRQEASE
jgi:signal transduction histidine kinase